MGNAMTEAPKTVHDRAAGEMADIMSQAVRRKFHLVAPEEMKGLRVQDIRQLHLFRLRERVRERKSVVEREVSATTPKATSVDREARAIDLLDPYPKLRGKAAMAKLRELDASLFPEFKSEDAATLYEDNFWRRIKYERNRRKL
jgi:hypothetical protein